MQKTFFNNKVKQKFMYKLNTKHNYLSDYYDIYHCPFSAKLHQKMLQYLHL